MLGRQVLERPWPTPTARLGARRGAQAKRYHNSDRSNELDDAVAASEQMWATPCASDLWHRTESYDRGDGALDAGWWSTEPDVGRVAHGVPARVDRLHCLGNALVPQSQGSDGESSTTKAA